MSSINLSTSTQRNLNLGNLAAARANSASSNLASGKRDTVAVNVSDELTANSTRSSLKAASTGASSLLDFLGTAQGYLSQVSAILDSMKTLATTGNSDVVSDAWRANAAAQLVILKAQLDTINSGASFKGALVFGGGSSGIVTGQVGASSTETYSTSAITNVDSSTLALDGAIDSRDNANALSGQIDAAIATVGTLSANVEIDIDALNQQLTVNSAYDEALGSQISDLTETDPATEMANYTKNNVLQQAAQAMLSKDFQNQQGVLGLLINR